MSFSYELAKFISFRDLNECERVRNISKEDLTNHPNPEFKIQIVEDPMDFYSQFALDIVSRIKAASDRGERFVAIMPVGPVPQYKLAAGMINRFRISCEHVHIFAMDEYADECGNTVPESWPGSFQKAMWDNLLNRIDEGLRPPRTQVHFPTTDIVNDYSKMLDDLGGADICYGGIGWCGHIAFWESHLGLEFGDDLEAYKQAGARLVELHPMTVMQNALHSFSGDWSWVPPKANTIGPKDILGAKHRSFWLDGAFGGGVSWQRFIARLVAHGPVNTLVPGSILQTVPTDFNILGRVADNVEIHMA